MSEIVIFLEVQKKQQALHILMKPIFERFIQIDRMKTSYNFLCSDAKEGKGVCFLLSLKTYRDHDVVATISLCSHYNVVG